MVMNNPNNEIPNVNQDVVADMQPVAADVTVTPDATMVSEVDATVEPTVTEGTAPSENAQSEQVANAIATGIEEGELNPLDIFYTFVGTAIGGTDREAVGLGNLILNNIIDQWEFMKNAQAQQQAANIENSVVDTAQMQPPEAGM